MLAATLVTSRPRSARPVSSAWCRRARAYFAGTAHRGEGVTRPPAGGRQPSYIAEAPFGAVAAGEPLSCFVGGLAHEVLDTGAVDPLGRGHGHGVAQVGVFQEV